MSNAFIPYARQEIDDDDIRAVIATLKSDWLTTGPEIAAFEAEFAAAVGANHAVAVSNGTAALHAAMRAIGVGAGDEVIVPAITFAASANAAVYEGATPVFADVEADTLLIDVADAARRITPRTKAIVAVDYAGQPCDYDGLHALCATHGLSLVADACHAVGGSYKGRAVGTLADVSTFSFHPAKHMTTAEGGMCTTNDADKAAIMRRFRNHGLDSDHRARAEKGSFAYDMVELGYNYRLTDVQCALGRSQLKRLVPWVERRQAIAARYDAAFAGLNHVQPLTTRADRVHARHLYVIEINADACGVGRDGGRDGAHRRLRAAGIGANVHYAPVHLFSFYRARFGYGPGLCPVAERMAGSILTLPLFPAMTDGEILRVIDAVKGLAHTGSG